MSTQARNVFEAEFRVDVASMLSGVPGSGYVSDFMVHVIDINSGSV
jgi:hypothetical protein